MSHEEKTCTTLMCNTRWSAEGNPSVGMQTSEPTVVTDGSRRRRCTVLNSVGVFWTVIGCEYRRPRLRGDQMAFVKKFAVT